MRNINRHNVDMCCIQETKIKHIAINELNGRMSINFGRENKHYRKDFMTKGKNSVCKKGEIF